MRIWTLWVAAFLAFTARGAVDPKHPIHLSIYDFTLTGRYDRVRRIDLRPVVRYLLPAPGAAPYAVLDERRWELMSDGSNMIYEWNTNNPNPTPSFFRELQERSLQRMLDDGYIDKKIFDAVMEAMDLWKPHQLRYAVAWSEMTLAEAETLFEGKIPWDRVLDRPQKGPATPKFEKIRITRASVMMGTGYYWESGPNDTGAVKQAPMSWQKIDLHKPLAGIDRDKFPLVAEISRAVAEEGVLPGTLKEPLSALIVMAREEARQMNQPTDRFLIFARTLKQNRAKLFARNLSARLWDQKMFDWMHANPEDAAENFLKAPLPDDLQQDAIVFTTLTRISDRVVVEDLSEDDFLSRATTEGSLTLAQVRELRETLHDRIWRHFIFPDAPKQHGPVCVMDMTPIALSFTANAFAEAGLTEGRANALMRHFTAPKHSDLNIYAGYWGENGGIIPDPTGKTEHQILQNHMAMRVQNLSEAAALEEPVEYLGRVLATIYSYQRDELQDAPPLVLQNLINGVRQIGRPVLGEEHLIGQVFLDIKDLFRALPFVVDTSSAEIANQLESLGGRREPMWLVAFPEFFVTHKLPFTGQTAVPNHSWALHFDVDALEAIRARFAPSTQMRCSDEVRKLLRIHRSVRM